MQCTGGRRARGRAGRVGEAIVELGGCGREPVPGALRLWTSGGEGLVIAVLVSVAAADWVSGTLLAATAWRRRRPRFVDRLAHSPRTPLADEVEDWLHRQ